MIGIEVAKKVMHNDLYMHLLKKVLNKEVWTRLMFWLPESTDFKPNGQSVSMFDLKERLKGQTYGPLVALWCEINGMGPY